MNLGYLALLIAEIPLWITHMITEHEIDLGTFKHIKPTTTKELVDHFEENMAAARKALELLDDEGLRKPFSLKSNGQSLYSAPLMVDIGTTINHWVHHHSTIVNIEYVTHFVRSDGGYVKMKTGEELTVSKSKKEAMMERLGLRKD